MEYFSRFKSTVHSVAAQVTQALPGNPIFREYECKELVASGGPGHAWKIYFGVKISTKQLVSIWLFEKKFCEKWPRNDKEAFPEFLKRGVNQLTRLRHPRLLTVEHALEESRDTLAFCTEPVVTCLSNVYGGDCTFLNEIKSERYKLEEIEIKHGLFQIGEALAFLHNDAKLLHGNVSPSSVVINDKGAWKLAGFDFCILGSPNPSGNITFEVEERDRRSTSLMNPSLDYSAPELVQGVKCDTYADMFSIGMLAYSLFNDYLPMFEYRDLLDAYKANLDKIRTLGSDKFNKLPAELRDDIKACFNYTPELRPDSIQFTKIVYFDDTLVKTLNYLESLMQMDNTQKMTFFKGLPQVLIKFSKRPLLQKIFPYLTSEFNTPQLIPFILPSVFIIAEMVSNDEFSKCLFPPLIPVFSMTNPYQIVLLLLQKMPLLLKKTPEGDIKRHVLPLIYGAIMNDNAKIQELCLAIIPDIGKLVERDQMKTQLLPKLLKLVLEGNVLSIRIQTLVCIGKLMPTLDSWMVSDMILVALPKINSKEPGILMAILGIYKLAYENERFGIAREQCAKSVLPFLISTAVENTLNLNQFEQYVALVKLLLEKVEKEQRARLQQLSAGQEEQRSFQDFTEMINTPSSKTTNTAPDLDALAGIFAPSPAEKTTTAMNKGSGQLTLEEKKRLAAEQDYMRTTGKSPEPMAASKTSMVSGLGQPSLNNLLPQSSTSNPMFPQANVGSFGASGGGSGSSAMNNLFSPTFPSPKPAQPSSSNASFGFTDFASVKPISTQTSAFNSSGTTSSSSNNGFSGFSLPPPPSASNPVQRSGGFGGFTIPPPPGSSSTALPSGFSMASAKSANNDDILDLFKQQPAQAPNSAGIDELLAMANAMPTSNKPNGRAKDPFADLLK